MKNCVKVISLLTLVLMLTAVFASCGNQLSGTYSNGLDVSLVATKYSYTFKGNKVTETAEVSTALGGNSTTTKEGTYEIKTLEDDSMKIVISYKVDDSKTQSVEYTFEKGTEDGKSYISLNGIKYYKK